MIRDPAKVDAELVALLRGRARGAGEDEVRAALAPLSSAEEKTLRRALRGAAAGRIALGPSGWADVGRGLAPELAAARELSGYYALQAERDALAALVKGGGDQRPRPERAAGSSASGAEPVNEVTARTVNEKKRLRGSSGRAQELLGLFAYHRDAPLVARALRVSLSDLLDELDRLKIRRRAFRLTRGTDHDLPAAAPVSGSRSGPPRRRRPGAEKPAPLPAPSEREEQALLLKRLLAELGPRRALLAARLGAAGAPLSEAALLARFRAAGLERELSLRERDLIRALWARHKASESKVARELSTTPADLRLLVADRGLARELEVLRDRLRREARRARWPEARLAQVLHQRDELRELGLLEELDREVAARAGVIWTSLKGRPDARALLAKKLHLTDDDAVKLQRLLDLR